MEQLTPKILTKKIQSYISKSFYKKENLTKPEMITENSYLVWDGTDIAKSHAKYLEGLEYIYDADKRKLR